VKKTDCQAELRRLLEKGPPIYITDKHGLPLDNDGNNSNDNDNDEYIINLWYASDDQHRSAKLKGAKEGEEWSKLWNELNKFIIVEGKEANDDDGDGK
jgi:hypothetical protein